MSFTSNESWLVMPVIKKILRFSIATSTVILLLILIINELMIITVNDQILTIKDSEKLSDMDCIIVLGAGVKPDQTPSLMLKDRLNRGIEVYEAGISNKLLMSGDHGSENYDEVNVMKNYAITAGIDSEAIFMDHAGFSTYESIYRAKAIFGARKIIIVSQDYHLTRALFIANRLGLEAYGISAIEVNYSGQLQRDIREIIARNKDFIVTLFKPEPTFLGDHISLLGNGDITND